MLEFTLKAGTLHLGSRFVSPHIATMAAAARWSLDSTLDLDCLGRAWVQFEAKASVFASEDVDVTLLWGNHNLASLVCLAPTPPVSVRRWCQAMGLNLSRLGSLGLTFRFPSIS